MSFTISWKDVFSNILGVAALRRDGHPLRQTQVILVTVIRDDIITISGAWPLRILKLTLLFLFFLDKDTVVEAIVTLIKVLTVPQGKVETHSILVVERDPVVSVDCTMQRADK